MPKVTEVDPEARRFITGRTRPQVNTKRSIFYTVTKYVELYGRKAHGFTLKLDTVKVPVIGLWAQRSA